METSFRGQLKPIGGVQFLRQDNLYSKSTVYYNEDRLRLSGSLSKSWFYTEVANETRFFAQSDNYANYPVSFTAYTPFWNARWKLQEEQNSSIVTRLDRAFVQASFEPIEIRIGKQIVPIGVGHIFTAVSQTPRYSFVEVDYEYDRTEDAATVIWKKGIRLEGRYLPKNPGQEKDNFHLRWLFDLKGADTALIAGQSDDKLFAGIESTRNVADAVMRSEVVVYEKNSVYHAQALVGWDKVWNAKWTTKHELFLNGFGKDSGYMLEPFSHRSSNFRGKYYYGNLVTYEWSPKLKANLLAIVNISDPSFLFHLYFNYSLSDNLDLMLGHFQNVGTKEESEFGGKQPLPLLASVKAGLPDLSYLLVKWTF